jgi:hypothetical protein
MKNLGTDRAVSIGAGRPRRGAAAGRLLTLAGLLLALAPAGGCATVQTAAGNIPGGVGGAVTEASLPSSGGTSINAAQAIRQGETVEGVVHAGQPRFYAVSLNRGQTVRATFYSRIAVRGNYSGPSQLPVFAFLDTNGGVLKREMSLTRETLGGGGFDRAEMEYYTATTRNVIVRVDCEECGRGVHYRLVVQ